MGQNCLHPRVEKLHPRLHPKSTPKVDAEGRSDVGEFRGEEGFQAGTVTMALSEIDPRSRRAALRRGTGIGKRPASARQVEPSHFNEE